MVSSLSILVMYRRFPVSRITDCCESAWSKSRYTSATGFRSPIHGTWLSLSQTTIAQGEFEYEPAALAQGAFGVDGPTVSLDQLLCDG